MRSDRAKNMQAMDRKIYVVILFGTLNLNSGKVNKIVIPLAKRSNTVKALVFLHFLVAIL